MKKYILMLSIFFQCSLCFAQQDIDLLWKARALKGDENIEALQKKMKNGVTLELQLKSMLESAYAAIITTPDITVKKTSDKIVYHLIMNFGKNGLLDVAYIYDIKTYEYLAVRVDILPKNISVICMSGKQLDDYLMFNSLTDTNAPLIVFSKSNPLGAFVKNKDVFNAP